MTNAARLHLSISGILRMILKISVVLALIVVTLFALFNLPGIQPREDISFGVTFSSRFARDMGINPQEALEALFRDLRVRKVRIPVYWDRIELTPDHFDFSDIDWQLDLAQRYDVRVILAVGQKVPRWPECFVPGWVGGNGAYRVNRTNRFIAETINRYKNRSEIVMWQIENEPFLAFGICDPLSTETLDREIGIAKMVDPSRLVLTTDSGELSTWFAAADRGDVFGTTLYRRIWNDRIGYVTYPIGPSFFRLKEWFTRVLTRQQNFIVIELQAEPWSPGSLSEVPLSEQWKTMDASKLHDNVVYARKVGFSEVYLWGAEWWYWLMTARGDPSLWDEARRIFESSR